MNVWNLNDITIFLKSVDIDRPPMGRAYDRNPWARKVTTEADANSRSVSIYFLSCCSIAVDLE